MVNKKYECQEKVLETLRHHDLKWIHTQLDIHRTYYGLFSILSLIFSFVAVILAWRAFFN